MLLKQIKDVFQGKCSLSSRRSSRWPSVRKEHLKKFPVCAVCGSSKKLEVHHIVSFVEDPSKELDPSNLITLCESKSRGGLNCHLIFGHRSDYKKINPNVVEDSLIWNKKLANDK